MFALTAHGDHHVVMDQTQTAAGTAQDEHSVAPAVAAACSRCGRDGEFDFGDVWLCLDCYHVAGSTCAGLNRPTPTDNVC